MKIKFKTCIRCGHNPKEEKSGGCYFWNKFVSKKHLYTINCTDEEIAKYKENGRDFIIIN